MGIKVQYGPLKEALKKTENPKDILSIMKVVAVLMVMSQGQTAFSFFFQDYLKAYQNVTNIKRLRTIDKEKACSDFLVLFERKNDSFTLSKLAKKICYSSIEVTIIYKDSNNIFARLSRFKLVYFKPRKTPFINIDLLFFKNCHVIVEKIYCLEVPWVENPPRITSTVDNLLILLLFLKINAMLFYKDNLRFKGEFSLKKDLVIKLLNLPPSLLKRKKDIAKLLDLLSRLFFLTGIGFILNEGSCIKFIFNANIFNTKVLAVWGNHLVIRNSKQLVQNLYAHRLETDLNLRSYEIIPITKTLLDTEILAWKQLNRNFFEKLSQPAKNSLLIACNSFTEILKLLLNKNVFQFSTKGDNKLVIKNVTNYDKLISSIFEEINKILDCDSQYQSNLIRSNLNSIRCLALLSDKNVEFKYISDTMARRDRIFPLGYKRDESNYSILPNRFYEKLDRNNNLPLINLPKKYKHFYYNLAFLILQIPGYVYNVDIKSCHATIALYLVQKYAPIQYNDLVRGKNQEDILSLFNYRLVYENNFPSSYKQWISLKQMKGLYNSLLYGRRKNTIYMKDLIDPTTIPKLVAKGTLDFINSSLPGKIINLWLEVITHNDLTMLGFTLPNVGPQKIKNNIIQEGKVKVSHKSQSVIQCLECLIINALVLDITIMNGKLLSLEHDGLVFTLAKQYSYEQFKEVKFSNFNQLCMHLEFQFVFEYEIW